MAPYWLGAGQERGQGELVPLARRGAELHGPAPNRRRVKESGEAESKYPLRTPVDHNCAPPSRPAPWAQSAQQRMPLTLPAASRSARFVLYTRVYTCIYFCFPTHPTRPPVKGKAVGLWSRLSARSVRGLSAGRRSPHTLPGACLAELTCQLVGSVGSERLPLAIFPASGPRNKLSRPILVHKWRFTERPGI